MFGLGPWEFAVVGLLAVLLFGKKLPEVARSLGKGVTEFKKGMQGIEEEIEGAGQPHPKIPHSTDKEAPEAPKFEPPDENEGDEDEGASGELAEASKSAGTDQSSQASEE